MKEYALSVDCCSTWTTLGLAENGSVRGEINIDAGKNQSAVLPGLFQQLLESFFLKPEDISLFGVVTGPGSFTGIKVGISFVSFLAWAGGKKVVPLSSLECLAFEKIGKPGGIAASVLWGGGGRIYGGLYTSKGNASLLTPLLQEGTYTPESFLEAFSSTGYSLRDVLWLTDRPEKTAHLFSLTEDLFERVIPSGASIAELTLMHRERARCPSEIRAAYFRDPDVG